jgi:4-amino-4-deoxy-L-arabinose transferase-like glycosyltransferase
MKEGDALTRLLEQTGNQGIGAKMKNPPAINWPIAIALLLMIGFVALMQYGLGQVFATWGFWTYIAVCVGGFAIIVVAAFGYDFLEARSRRPPPPGPHDRPSSRK